MPRRRSKKKPTTLVEKGRTLIEAERRDLRGEVIIDGVRPRRGMWLIHEGRRRVYGRILRVRAKQGEVVIQGSFGTTPFLPGATLFEGGYSYATELPTGDGWAYRHNLNWLHEPPPHWPEGVIE